MMAILYADDEPAIKKAQAPAQWQDIAEEYSTESAALHPFSMAPSTTSAEKSRSSHHARKGHHEKNGD